MTSPFNLHHAVTLTFDLLQGQVVARAGDHNSPNLLVGITSHILNYCFWLRISDEGSVTEMHIWSI